MHVAVGIWVVSMLCARYCMMCMTLHDVHEIAWDNRQPKRPRESRTRCMACGTRYMVHGTWYTVHGTWHMVRGTWYMARGARYMVHGTWYTVHGTWHVVHGAWYMACGTRYMIHGTVCFPQRPLSSPLCFCPPFAVAVGVGWSWLEVRLRPSRVLPMDWASPCSYL